MAIGGLLADPVQFTLLHAPIPIGTEAEKIAVKRVFDGAAVDQVTDVNDVAADGVGGCQRLERRGRLHEFDFVAFGVLDVEPQAAVFALFHLGRHLPCFGAKIAAQGFGIVGLPGDVVEAVDAGIRRQRQHFNELRGAEGVADALGVFGVGLPDGSDDLAVVAIGGGGVRGIDGDVGYAGDPGAREGFVGHLSGG